MQGIILAVVIIGVLIGIVIGYLLRQSRVSELSEALQESQERNQSLERKHEKRLRQATQQLQQDYESQLAEKIERYQDQLETRIETIEKEYQGRLSVTNQGQRTLSSESAHPTDETVPPVRSQAAASETDEATIIERRIKNQYETRLKEAAQKIQQAYEQHLRQKLRDHKADLQHHYEMRLAQKIEHYEDQLSARLTQLEEEYQLRMQAVAAGQYSQPMLADPSEAWPETSEATPSATTTANDNGQMEALEARLREEYEHRLTDKIEHYQDDFSRRLEDLEAEYEARLRVSHSGVENPTDLVPADSTSNDQAELQAQYEQKLAEKIEHYQDDLSLRMEELQQEYEARLQVVQAHDLEASGQLEPTENTDLEETLALEENAAAAAPEPLPETAVIADTPSFDAASGETKQPSPADFSADLADINPPPSPESTSEDITPDIPDFSSSTDISAAPVKDFADFQDSELSLEPDISSESPLETDPSASPTENINPSPAEDFADFVDTPSAADNDFLSDISSESSPSSPALDFDDDENEFSAPVENLGDFSNDVAEDDVEALLAGLSDNSDSALFEQDLDFGEETSTPQEQPLEVESLDEVLSMEHAPELGEELDLGDESGEEFNLDDLLFEEVENNQDPNNPFDPDDPNNLS